MEGSPDREGADWTPADAMDPSASAATLDRIARERPDLRPLIVLNPAAPQQVLDFIAERGQAAADSNSVAGSAVATSQDSGEGDSGSSSDSSWGPDGEFVPPKGDGTAKKRRVPSRATAARRWLLRSSTKFAIVAGFAVAVFAAGAVSGWSVQAELQSRRTAAEPEVIRVPVNSVAAREGAIMPDLRGLLLEDARQVLGDAGIAVDSVDVRETPAAGTAGTVVSQTPSFDTVAPEEVVLTVSTPALVPVLAGRAGTAVADELGALGAVVTIDRRYVAGAAVGAAVAVVPAEGEPLPSTVALTVAEAGGSVFLGELDSTGGGCSSGSQGLNGQEFQQALSCRLDGVGEEPRVSQWTVGRHADVLEATVGVPDDGNSEDRVGVEVFADGRLVASVEAGWGEPVALSAPISGALRLELRSRLLQGSNSSGYSSAEVVLGGARIVGSQDEIDLLAAGR